MFQGRKYLAVVIVLKKCVSFPVLVSMEHGVINVNVAKHYFSDCITKKEIFTTMVHYLEPCICISLLSFLSYSLVCSASRYDISKALYQA